MSKSKKPEQVLTRHNHVISVVAVVEKAEENCKKVGDEVA